LLRRDFNRLHAGLAISSPTAFRCLVVEVDGAWHIESSFPRSSRNVIESVSGGDPLCTALRRAGNFQPLLMDIIAIGEQTGQLARSLQKAAARYDKELDTRIKRLTALISPIIIIFLAAVVTVIAYCIVTSIFSAVSGIRSQTG
jgi:type II secretory pathway component PulF